MEKEKDCRYWFEKYYVSKPVENEEKIFNKYKGLVKWALTKVKCRLDQDDDLISVGNMALLKKIRYNKYYKNKSRANNEKFRDFFMQVIIGAMLLELKKQNLKHDAKLLPIIDDFDTSTECDNNDGKILSNEDAIINIRWRDEKTKTTVLKEIKPAIHGTPESIYEKNTEINNIIKLVDSLPIKEKETIYDYFGLNNGVKMTYKAISGKRNVSTFCVQKRIKTGLETVKKEYIRIYGNEI